MNSTAMHWTVAHWTVVPARDFARHAGRWQRLHAAGAASPVLAADFVQALLDVFGTGRELLAWHGIGEDTDAMTIVAPSRFGTWDTFQPAQAPVGLWLQLDARPADGLLASLLQALPGPALMVGLTQCDPMLMARPAAGVPSGARSFDYIQTARITLQGSFDDYWNARGKNLRNNLKKQRNRLRQDGIATRLEIVRAPERMAGAVADYGRLETSGWKAGQGTAVAADNDQGRFYRAMLEALARRGAASVYRYWLDGPDGPRLAAMDLCIEGGGCIVILKTAYDEALGPQLSPALLMREEATRGLFDEGRFERIEFYGRVMEWHTRWTDEIRTMYHLNGYRWPWLGRLHALAAQRKKRNSKINAATPAPAAAATGS
ncbi:GNAT family N-acetyltransferase [Massilia rhizosphaerae]|uniref:GNAT family N-acetyltransferase n=1 Tax=Massilia rhizosphaerae TaxID=2784389 RepID=UPI001E2A0BF9|nr:GNAT family N-acetyltransferase [Massilia rhizosphaerae]